jgi:antitoxin HicB
VPWSCPFLRGLLSCHQPDSQRRRRRIPDLPDLPGCLSDGETEAEAVTNGKDAFKTWVSTRKDSGKEIPAPIYRPDTVPEVSGKFETRLPKSVHAKLAERAKTEGVSLNSLVLAFVAEGLGRKAA